MYIHIPQLYLLFHFFQKEKVSIFANPCRLALNFPPNCIHSSKQTNTKKEHKYKANKDNKISKDINNKTNNKEGEIIKQVVDIQEIIIAL